MAVQKRKVWHLSCNHNSLLTIPAERTKNRAIIGDASGRGVERDGAYGAQEREVEHHLGGRGGKKEVRQR